MQCPNCDHGAEDSEFGSPAKCPSCGVYYEKALAHRRRVEASANQAADKDASDQPSVSDKLMRGLIGAKLAVEAGRMGRNKREREVADRLDPKSAQAVVVVDLRMNFWSMVWFMVKWAIAAIPALLILAMMFVFAVSFVGELGRYR
jgi:hypothetical protein